MWPDGSDVEVFSMSSLHKAFLSAKGLDREHVTFYIWKNIDIFKTIQLKNKYDWSKYRYTIDYQEDLNRLIEIMQIIKRKKIFGTTEEIISIIDKYFKKSLSNKKYSFGFGWNKN